MMQRSGRGSHGWTVGLGGCGLVLGAGLGMACAPDPGPDPRVCSNEIVGEPADWDAEVPVATPECVDLPPEPAIGFCMRREGDPEPPEFELDLKISGKIVELGTGVPDDACGSLDNGNHYDEVGNLAFPPDGARWIRVDVGGEVWMLVFGAPNDAAPLAVGDAVTAWAERGTDGWGSRFRFDLRDAEGEPLWWFTSDIVLDPLEATPGCVPLRLGEPVCNSADACLQQQHHALEIGGTMVGPYEQAVVDGLRFTNGASWLSYESSCSDTPYGYRMVAASREG